MHLLCCYEKPNELFNGYWFTCTNAKALLGSGGGSLRFSAKNDISLSPLSHKLVCALRRGR